MHTSEVRHIKPVYGRFKCNIDVSFSIRHNRVGICACFSDANNDVTSKAVWISPIVQSMWVKLMSSCLL